VPSISQNLCDDRSTVRVNHPALALTGSSGVGGSCKVDCEDCVIETAQGNGALHVGVFAATMLFPALLPCVSSSRSSRLEQLQQSRQQQSTALPSAPRQTTSAMCMCVCDAVKIVASDTHHSTTTTIATTPLPYRVCYETLYPACRWNLENRGLAAHAV
jgi:hypothetical protein